MEIDMSFLNTLLASAPPITGGGGQTVDHGVTGSPAGPTGGTSSPSSPFGGQFILIIFLLFGVMIFMQMMTGRKEKKRRQAMLSDLGRHDRIQTIGGIIGTITEIKGDEVLLKIDESTNTKVHVARSAVQTVLKKSGQAASDEPIETPERLAS